MNQRRSFHALLRTLLVYLVACVATSTSGQTWDLPPVVGDKTEGWRSEPNWTWEHGNPYKLESGGTWRLCTQFSLRPEPESRHTDMVQGWYVDFERIWKGEKQEGRNPSSQYRGYRLGARSADRPGEGMGSVLMWRPPSGGGYHVTVAGTVKVQNQSAGYARVQVYVLAEDEASAEVLQEYLLNERDGFRSDRYPDRFVMDQTVELPEGSWLALRLQAINPGPAPVGSVAIDFSPDQEGNFRIQAAEPVTEAPAAEPQ